MNKLFDTKRTYIGNDGDEYIDMCIPVVTVKDMVGNEIKALNHDENGRLDNFVWKSVSKNQDMIDIVMYANHIFNPFAVKEGEVLNIPVENKDLFRSSDEPALPDGSKHSKNTQGEKEKTYAENIEYLAKKGMGVK